MRQGPPDSWRFGLVSITAGVALLGVQMVSWFYSQDAIELSGRSSTQVYLFFLLELIYLGMIVTGARLLRSRIEVGSGRGDLLTLGGVISSALRSTRDLRIGTVVGALYGVFYAIVSSVLVYQPTVDFASAYGVASPALATVACCGYVGGTPVMVVYIAPQLHLGIQLIPLDLLFITVIPILIAINATIAFFAVKKRPRGGGGLLLGGVGATVGLFTACPTCAGYFLATAFGSLGAATLAVALAPYQLAFVAVSVPILLVSPFLTAASLRRAVVAECRVSGQD